MAIAGAAHQVVRMPAVRTVAAHAARYLMLGTVIPMGLFYGTFRSIGLNAALLIGLAWSLALIGNRMRRGRRVEATLILSTILVLARVAITWGTGSTFVYFLQPVIGTYLTAIALIGSVLINRPFTQRVTRDYVPLPQPLLAHPAITTFFTRVSLLWGTAYLINGSVTVWILTHASVGRFIIVSKAAGLGMSGLALLVSVALLIFTLQTAPITLRWGRHRDHPTAPSLPA